MHQVIGRILADQGFPPGSESHADIVAAAQSYLNSPQARGLTHSPVGVRIAESFASLGSAKSAPLAHELINRFAQYAHLHGHLEGLLKQGVAWMKAAEHLRDPRLMIRACNIAAAAEMTHLNAGPAKQMYAMAMKVATEELRQDEPAFLGAVRPVLTNLGLLSLWNGDLKGSIAMSETAISVASAEEPQLPPRNNLAIACLFHGDFDRGFSAADWSDVDPRHIEGASTETRVLRQWALACLNLEIGEHALAVKHAEHALGLCEGGAADRALLSAYLAAATTFGYVGRHDEAFGYLEKVFLRMPGATSFWMSSLWGASKLHASQGEHAEAARLMAKMREIVSTGRQRLALTRLSIPVMLPEIHASEDDTRQLLLAQLMHERSAKEQEEIAAELSMLEGIAQSALMREDPSGKSPYRVGSVCEMLALEMTHDIEFARRMGMAGRILDIGKCVVPDYVFNAGHVASDEDRAQIREHVRHGLTLVNSTRVDHLWDIVRAVAEHHENWDGSGYPSALEGEAISLAGRIAAVADSFAAMISPRPWRAAMGITQALSSIEADSGTRFCPQAVRALKQFVTRQLAAKGEAAFLRDLEAPARTSAWGGASEALEHALASIDEIFFQQKAA